ncbi:hypothetical protein ACSW95_16390 (plasmid) [Clostridium perfringens]|uniref:hypothetical protein n=1 Tax=Clostridium perfringens TaxID=1502 RepID=UPI001ABB9EF3|nr:hypothetical protein [Clostridium perfringens]EIF2088134.1 hypothetical protein [Clostridium perfringens]EIF2808635.1 hypothetical protein [Clostridium perfringens]ELC8311481.1 hypothetical protein [Clostridium perfringens]ELC8354937.1 hypothetical protein [Clostridium perfringens]ELC8411457.1 hypothetical protein [Clostridium perfringens]
MLVQDLAKELNVTRSEIYNILRKKKFAPLVKKNGSQIIIDNELSKLLKEELENKKHLTPKEIKDIKKTKEIHAEVSVTTDENLYQNTINILQSQIENRDKQIKFKDKQISILNNVIENNLKIIKLLEEKQSSYKYLHEEVELLKNTLLDLTKRKNKKRFSIF